MTCGRTYDKTFTPHYTSNNMAIVATKPSGVRALELVARYGPSASAQLSSARSYVISGSEAAAASTGTRYKSRNEYIMDKIYGAPFVDNEHTRHGNFYEPVAIARFEAKTGAKVHKVGFMVHPDHPWLGGTLDGIAIMPDGEGVVIEVKCPLTRSISSKGLVPDYYIPQVQLYLALTGLDRALFIQFKPARVTPARKIERPEQLVITSIHRNDGMISSMIAKLWSTWVEVVIGREARLPVARAWASWLCARRRCKQGSVRTKLAEAAFKKARMFYPEVAALVKYETELCNPLPSQSGRIDEQ
jgi:putative phage-type endonuclease